MPSELPNTDGPLSGQSEVARAANQELSAALVDLAPTFGFVAFLDVLGFRSLIGSANSGERLEIYLRSLQEALAIGPATPTVEYVVFSDSIVLTTPDASDASLQVLLQKCSAAFGILLERDIALRGAIACGEYFRWSASSRGVFVAGRPIVEAYAREEDQDWIGIMLTPSVLRQVPELPTYCEITQNPTPEALQSLKARLEWAVFVQEFTVTFHSAPGLERRYHEGFAVVPSRGEADPGRLLDSLEISLKKLTSLKLVAPDPEAQAKYARTRSFLDAVTGRWSAPVARMRQLQMLDMP